PRPAGAGGQGLAARPQAAPPARLRPADLTGRPPRGRSAPAPIRLPARGGQPPRAGSRLRGLTRAPALPGRDSALHRPALPRPRSAFPAGPGPVPTPLILEVSTGRAPLTGTGQRSWTGRYLQDQRLPGAARRCHGDAEPGVAAGLCCGAAPRAGGRPAPGRAG